MLLTIIYCFFSPVLKSFFRWVVMVCSVLFFCVAIKKDQLFEGTRLAVANPQSISSRRDHLERASKTKQKNRVR